MADLDFQPLDFQPDEGDQQNRVPPPTGQGGTQGPASAPALIPIPPAPPPAAPQAQLAAPQATPQAGGLDFQPLDFQPAANTESESQKPTPPEQVPNSIPPPSYVKDEELASIAHKHNINPEDLRSVAPYFGVELKPQNAGELISGAAKTTAGAAGEMALGIPQFLYKKSQSTDFQEALDDLHELSQTRKSLPEKALEFGRNLVAPLPGLGVESKLGRVGIASGIGAVAGATGAKTGEELKGAELGAGLGAGLGVGGEALTYFLGRAANKISPAELENVRTRQFDLQKGGQEISQHNAESENLIGELTFGQRTSLSEPEIDTILEQQLGNPAVEAYLNPTTSEGKAIREAVADRTGAEPIDVAVKRQLVDDIIDERIRDFGEVLTKERPKNVEDALSQIKEYASRQGDEATVKKWDNFWDLENTKKWIEENGSLAKDQPGWFGQTANKLSDNQYALRHIDDKYGTQSEESLRELNKAINRYTFARNMTREDLDKIYQLASKTGLDNEVRGGQKIYNALENPELLNQLSPQEQQVAQKFRDYFDNVREFSNHVVQQKDPNISPLNIPYLENYVPHIPKNIDEVVPLVENKIEEVLQTLSAQTGREVKSLAELSPQEFRVASETGTLNDLIEFANWGTAAKRDFRNGADLSRVLDEALYTREGNIALESRARAAMARTGEIPDFILEKNLYKLADKYALNTMKHLYLRQGLDKLNLEADKLAAVKAGPESEYVRRIAQDTLGIRKGTAAEAFLQAKVQAARKFDDLIDKYGANSPQGTVLTFAKNIPDMLYGATRNIYTNILGYWNVKSALMHMGTSVARLPPELGTRYGYSTVFRGALNTVANLGRNLERAQAMGNMPAEFVRKGERAIRDGLLSSKSLSIPVDSFNALSHAGMALFQTGEKWNRALAIGTADMMASDLVRNSNLAWDAVRRFPASIRQQIVASKDNEKVLGTVLAKYLNDTAQFNYNRSSLFEFGRSLGPLFSTFSKWPTSVAGEALYEFRSKGMVGGSLRSFERLVTPYLMLSGLNTLMTGGAEKKELSDRAQKFTWEGGLSHVAPIGALKEFTGGKIFTPPMVDMAMKGVIIPALEGNPGKMGHGLDTALYNYAPGSGLVRFLTDDLVTYVTGHRPEGKSFTERTANSLRKAVK